MLSKDEVRIIVECHDVSPTQCKLHDPSCHLVHPECAIAMLAREVHELLDLNKKIQYQLSIYQCKIPGW